MTAWQAGRFAIDLRQPRIMGVVNVTPDSFSDGGEHADTASALAHCERLVREGADILDIGGESTRPGSPRLALREELDRVLPVIRGALGMGVPVSIDTYKPDVMRAALDAGVDIVNDVSGFRDVDAAALMGDSTCGVCIMHMHGVPQTMQKEPMQGDAVPQVLAFLRKQTRSLMEHGVRRERIMWDPGIGFGKTVHQNFALLARQTELLGDAYPLLAGWSRKSSIGAALQGDAPHPPPADQRLAGSLAAALLAVERGAHVVRVHDVRETVQVLAVWRAMKAAESLGA